MPDHRDRPPNALAHGPAKPSDIERVRQDARAVAARLARPKEDSVAPHRPPISRRVTEHQEHPRP
jgi:hypothetical protein